MERHQSRRRQRSRDHLAGRRPRLTRVGDVLQAQGKLEAAQAAFGEDLAISRRLAEQDPSNADWQQDLAVAHSRVGGVLQTQGKLEAAQTIKTERQATMKLSALCLVDTEAQADAIVGKLS